MGATQEIMAAEHVAKCAVTFFNALHNKDAKLFAKQFLAPGDNNRWRFLNVLPGAVLVKDSAKLIAMHDGWFASSETAFKPYRDEFGLDREFTTEDLQYCEAITDAEDAIRCGVDAFVVKEKNLGEGGRNIITSPMHLAMIFAFDQESDNWWVTQINNTPLSLPEHP